MEKNKRNKQISNRTTGTGTEYQPPRKRKTQSQTDLDAIISGAYQRTSQKRPVRQRPARPVVEEEQIAVTRQKAKPHTVRKSGPAGQKPKTKAANVNRKKVSVEERRSIQVPEISKEKEIQNLQIDIPASPEVIKKQRPKLQEEKPIFVPKEPARKESRPETVTPVVPKSGWLESYEEREEQDSYTVAQPDNIWKDMKEISDNAQDSNYEDDLFIKPPYVPKKRPKSEYVDRVNETVQEDSAQEIPVQPEQKRVGARKPAVKQQEKRKVQKKAARKSSTRTVMPEEVVEEEVIPQNDTAGRRANKRSTRANKSNGNKKTIAIAAAGIILVILGGIAIAKMGRSDKPVATAPEATTQAVQKVEETKEDKGKRAEIMETARTMAMGYDYDGAIDLLKSINGWENDQEIQGSIDEYTQQKAECVPIDPLKVPHVFYHSLVNNPDMAFDVETRTQLGVDHFNAWMTTVEEFDKITQELYDRGYVYVRLRDLVVETKDENGNVHFEKNENLLLPPDKKPIVLSVDDLSYYHTYETASYPDKLVVDENGDVKCHYVKPDGSEEIGDFDVVPRLNTFLTEHPDGAYKGARGLIALTGYNGVMGYRTDIDYKVKEHLQEDQEKWLNEHPDFDYEKECAEATVVADAVKESGWEFASHTWGHINVTDRSLEDQMTDNGKWEKYVASIVGPVDTIIFAFGNDIGVDIKPYTMDNEKYAYYKSAGYNFFCNIDGSQPYYVEIMDDYVRQSRLNFDGYRMYEETQGRSTILEQFFDADEVFDQRRPTPVNPMG